MLDWLTLDGPWIQCPYAVALAPDRLALFALDTDHDLRLRWRVDNVWGDWESLGRTALTAPSAVAHGPETLDIFSVGRGHGIEHRRWRNGRWGAWTCLEGETSSVTLNAPRAVWSRPDRLDMFVHGNDNAVWRKWRQGERWSGWERCGILISRPPWVVSRRPGSIDLLVIGQEDNKLYHRALRGASWGEWRSAADETALRGPWAAVAAEGRIKVITVGDDRGMNLHTWDGDWRDVVHLHGEVTTDARVVAGPGDRLDVFCIGEDDAVWHRYRLAGGWTRWTSLGGEAFSPLGVVGYPDRIELFTLDLHSAIAHAVLPIQGGRLPAGGDRRQSADSVP